jgi:cytidylate kinase
MEAGRLKQYLRDLDRRRAATSEERRYSIAVSRECFAYGNSTCQELSKRLGWPVYGYNLLEIVANEMQVSKAAIAAMDEEGQQWMTDMMRIFEGRPDQSAFVVHWKEVLGRLARDGRAIFLGRGTSVLMPPETCLRVRIVADLDLRIKRCMERLSLDRRKATKKVQQTDEQRAAFVRHFFHIDVADPHNYDMVLSSDGCTPTQCADAVFAVAQSRWPDFAGTKTRRSTV